MSGPVVIATAGHVDHGKTALVRALTGRDTDRLAAEKERGISIELGFAPLVLPSGRAASLIDVPGHERFVRHMVAGVTGVDGFILCVAADDGVMPQTREHLAVLALLGIRAGVVAITRSDLADPARAASEVADLLPGGTAVVPVCAPDGVGVERLRAALDRVATDRRPRVRDGPARLWIDRSFSVAGAGTVVTGTLWGGALGVGDQVSVLPAGATGRVRGIQVHDAPVERVQGGRVALALAGVGRSEAGRGSCIVRAGDAWASTDRLGVSLEAVRHADGPLRSGAVLQCFLGTHEGPGACVLLDRGRLDPGDHCLAELRLQRAVCARAGDRLVLRSAAGTVAGAGVIDAHPPAAGTRRARAERLTVLAAGDPAAALELRAREGGLAGVELHGDPAARDRVVALGGRAFHPAVLARARAAALGAVGTEGGTVAGVRAATGLPAPAAEAAVDALIRDGEIVRRGARLVPPSPDADAAPGVEAVGRLLAEAGLHAPTARRLAELSDLGDGALRAALAALEEAGAAQRVGELWFDPAALDDAWATARLLLRDGPTGIAALRDAWGVGRRHALAIAGHLDERGLTKREGDRRVLRRGGQSS